MLDKLDVLQLNNEFSYSRSDQYVKTTSVSFRDILLLQCLVIIFFFF